MVTTIFIIGMPGSGKSTLAEKLARHFNATAIDLDKVIEEKEGKSINEIFAHKSESYFRELEKGTLQKLTLGHQLQFISTGGGTPCFFDNMQWMKNNGVVIYLNIPASILIGRLKEGKETRPLIKNMDDEILSDYVRETLTNRAPFYEMADIIVNHNKNLNLLKTELSFLFINQNQ